MSAKRIISLLPSCTEIVCILGCGEQLVGRSHECDFPPEVKSLPVCTSSRIDAQASSRQIDDQVKNLLRQSLSIYDIDLEMLRRIKPEIILTQAQCEVCAVSMMDVEKALADWTGARPQVISLSPVHLADVWENIREVSVAIGVEERGREVLKGLKTRCVDIIQKACMVKRRPKVACIEWIEPLMAAGNWVPELVELAGGANLFGEAGKHSPWMEWSALVEKDPDIIVVMPCGFDIDRSRQELKALSSRPEWWNLRAVREGQVFLTDGNQYFNRPGPRLVESLEILAEIFQPKLFPIQHKGSGWACS